MPSQPKNVPNLRKLGSQQRLARSESNTENCLNIRPDIYLKTDLAEESEYRYAQQESQGRQCTENTL